MFSKTRIPLIHRICFKERKLPTCGAISVLKSLSFNKVIHLLFLQCCVRHRLITGIDVDLLSFESFIIQPIKG